MNKLKHNFKKISFDLIGALISILVVIILVPFSYFPDEAKVAFSSLILTKFILITLGNVHFFISRKLLFPYIDFSEETNWANNLMVIVMYATIVLSWARGG